MDNTEEFNELINTSLINTSREGDIDSFYTIIQKQPDILRRIDEKMFEHTPMHEAASTGKIPFTNEMMNLMPSFARKLNKEGQTPMHLALQNGNVELVFCLLNAEPDLVRVKGKNGMTTLHCAAEKGYYNLVANLLAICPKCIEDVNVAGETVVHIAVRERRSEVLEVVVGWLRRICHEDAIFWIARIGKVRNVEGQTALDIAVSSNEIKAIMLLDEIRAKSSDGRTSSSFLHGRTQQHRSRSKDPQTLAKYLRSELRCEERLTVEIMRARMRVSNSLRDALLVIAGLLITASFQAAYSSPVDFANNGASGSIIKHRKIAVFVFPVVANSLILFLAICMINFLLAEVSAFMLYLLLSYFLSIFFKAPDKIATITFIILVGIQSLLVLLTAGTISFGRRKVLKANQCRKNMSHEEVKAVIEEVRGSNAISIE